jgi:hypothetical protein
MDKLILEQSQEEKFLESGYLFALHFAEGWLVGRVIDKSWSNLEPWSLGAVAAGANLAAYDEVQDTLNRHFLEPPQPNTIYHTFWGVTPTPARIYVQYPTRTNLGDMLAVDRLLVPSVPPGTNLADVGYISGKHSPYNGPFSIQTELFTTKDQYPAFQVFNPLTTPMSNVMLAFQQMQYSYQIITDQNLIKSVLVGSQRCKKYTMGPSYKLMAIPQWLQQLVTDNLLNYSNLVMGGKA